MRNVRAQISTVFHLDKCIGCHTCSISCKNIWTDRKGAEYMWWNNVETKPGTGYPSLWEDQSKYRGGWIKKGDDLKLRATASKLGELLNIFYNPNLPTIDDYYEPFTYKYADLFDSPPDDDQPTARPISMITGDYMDIEAGPNWDDDLGGSPLYAENDINLDKLSKKDRKALFTMERVVFFYLPRICNHCLNPGCVASCPSRAIYKRGEDGIVLISQDKCRGWRFCVTGCPYKKTYFNWDKGKSEKCILCYPRLETGQAPACFHSCVGRIRYVGVMLYDADKILDAAKAEDNKLVEAQKACFLDPNDPSVIEDALKNGVQESWIDSARRSPVYRYIKEWDLALPLHPEFRTMPTLFYVPPLLPVFASEKEGVMDLDDADYFSGIESSRIPIKYMASLFGAGNEEVVRYSLRKIAAVRYYSRIKAIGDLDAADVDKKLSEADCTPEEANEIFKMTALNDFATRFVIPPFKREYSIQETERVDVHRGEVGFGSKRPIRRGP